MVRKKQKNQALYIIGGIFSIFVLSLIGVATFNVISVQDDFTLRVDTYVCKSCTESNSRMIGPFEESASFDFEIVNSLRDDDVFVYIVDVNDEKKLLFQQDYEPVCGGARGYTLQNFPYSAKVEITHNDNLIFMKNALTGEDINYITKSGSFGEGPYRVEFVVYSQRTTVCEVLQAGYVRKGVVDVSNVILIDYEDEIIVEEPIQEPIQEPIVEEVVDNELTGFVTIGGFTLRPIVAYLSFGAMIALVIGAVIYSGRNKKGGL